MGAWTIKTAKVYTLTYPIFCPADGGKLSVVAGSAGSIRLSTFNVG